MGYGFHEDGFRSGSEVASALSGVLPSWVRRRGHDALIPASKPALQALQVSLTQSLTAAFTRPFKALLQWICRTQVQAFLKSGFTKGHLTFVSPDGHRFSVKGSEPGLDKEVIVKIKNNWTWVRLAFESDLGMAKGYIAGEWEVDGTGANYDGLTQLMLVLLDNVPNGKAANRGVDFSRLFSAYVGSAINLLSYSFTMDNSISNSRSNIHAVSLSILRSHSLFLVHFLCLYGIDCLDIIYYLATGTLILFSACRHSTTTSPTTYSRPF